MSTIQKSGGVRTRLTRPPISSVTTDGMLTVDDWVALPDTKPRYELINGQLVQKPMTKRKHAQAVTQLLVECVIWGRTSGWKFFAEGPGLKSDDRNGFVPDITGFAPGHNLDPEAALELTAPNFVAEVLSRRTAKVDRTIKRAGYARAGVKLYIIVDPDKKTFEAHRLGDGVYGPPEILRENDVWQPAELPGLKLEFARLWF